jgi:hypothetical protein
MQIAPRPQLTKGPVGRSLLDPFEPSTTFIARFLPQPSRYVNSTDGLVLGALSPASSSTF